MSEDKGWNDMKRAKEEMFFDEENKRALAKIKARSKKRPSPITGEPMEEVTYKGVVIDRCPTSGGIWLDAGELEQIVNAAKAGGKEKDGEKQEDWLGGLFSFISKR